jgi:hypothetical protein
MNQLKAEFVNEATTALIGTKYKCLEKGADYGKIYTVTKAGMRKRSEALKENEVYLTSPGTIGFDVDVNSDYFKANFEMINESVNESSEAWLLTVNGDADKQKVSDAFDENGIDDFENFDTYKFAFRDKSDAVKAENALSKVNIKSVITKMSKSDFDKMINESSMPKHKPLKFSSLKIGNSYTLYYYEQPLKVKIESIDIESPTEASITFTSLEDRDIAVTSHGKSGVFKYIKGMQYTGLYDSSDSTEYFINESDTTMINESLQDIIAAMSKGELEYFIGAVIGAVASSGGIAFALIREAIRNSRLKKEQKQAMLDKLSASANK